MSTRRRRIRRKAKIEVKGFVMRKILYLSVFLFSCDLFRTPDVCFSGKTYCHRCAARYSLSVWLGCRKGIKLAAEEINAQGGVNVGGKKRPFQVEVIDTRDLEPGCLCRTRCWR